MGLFSTIAKAATTVASKVLTEVLNPLTVTQNSSDSKDATGPKAYNMGAVKWTLRNSVPYIESKLDGDPVGVTFSKTFINKDGLNQTDSDYVQLDFYTPYMNATDLLSKYNSENSMITVSPEGNEDSTNTDHSLLKNGNPLKRISTSISQIPVDQTFKSGTNIFCTLRKNGDVYGIELLSAAKAEHFIVNVQAIYGTEVALATYNSDDHQKADGSGTQIFLEFPEGTNFPNDIANSLFVEVIVDPIAHAQFTKGAIKGDPR